MSENAASHSEAYPEWFAFWSEDDGPTASHITKTPTIRDEREFTAQTLHRFKVVQKRTFDPALRIITDSSEPERESSLSEYQSVAASLGKQQLARAFRYILDPISNDSLGYQISAPCLCYGVIKPRQVEDTTRVSDNETTFKPPVYSESLGDTHVLEVTWLAVPRRLFPSWIATSFRIISEETLKHSGDSDTIQLKWSPN